MTNVLTAYITYLIAYILGGILSLSLANWLWYPASNLHGAALGLLIGGIFITGSTLAMIIVYISLRSANVPHRTITEK